MGGTTAGVSGIDGRATIDPGTLNLGRTAPPVTVGLSNWRDIAAPAHSSDPAARLIEDWADSYVPGRPPPRGFFYPQAIPYLALDWRETRPRPHLVNKAYGNPLPYINGLAVHCTGGPATNDPTTVAYKHCVEGWNDRWYRRMNAGDVASAHFAVAGNGKVIQFVPCSYQAFAQGMGGGASWLSVEVANPGSSPPRMDLANDDQIDALQKLFAWVCRTWSIRPEVATGHLINTPANKAWDDITRSVSGRGPMNTELTSDQKVAQQSRGLSCHRWLKLEKPCPGAGLLSQLPLIADGAAKLVGR